MATVRVRIVILTVRITLSVCPFNRMAHTANNSSKIFDPDQIHLVFIRFIRFFFGRTIDHIGFVDHDIVYCTDML
jgi:hypothetical protein